MVLVIGLLVIGLACGIGAWFGTGLVVHWPRRTIQRAMAVALVITALIAPEGMR